MAFAIVFFFFGKASATGAQPISECLTHSSTPEQTVENFQPDSVDYRLRLGLDPRLKGQALSDAAKRAYGAWIDLHAHQMNPDQNHFSIVEHWEAINAPLEQAYQALSNPQSRDRYLHDAILLQVNSEIKHESGELDPHLVLSGFHELGNGAIDRCTNLLLRSADDPPPNEQNLTYAKMMHLQALKSANELRAGVSKPFGAFLTSFAAVRNKVREQTTGMPDPDAFGVARQNRSHTGIFAEYQAFEAEAKSCMRTLSLNTQEQTATVRTYKEQRMIYTSSHDVRGENSFVGLEVRRRIPGTDRVVELTQIREDLGTKKYQWLHPTVSDSQAMVAYAGTLYEKLATPTLPRSDVIHLVAEWHWWMAQAMPWNRGSAGIVDAATKSLLYAHGIVPGRWKPGVSPDIKAFDHTLEDFVREYRSYFDPQ